MIFAFTFADHRELSFIFFLFNYSFVQIIVWTFILLLIWNSKICFNYREIDINVLFCFPKRIFEACSANSDEKQ